jgi:hypothetical protein
MAKERSRRERPERREHGRVGARARRVPAVERRLRADPAALREGGVAEPAGTEVRAVAATAGVTRPGLPRAPQGLTDAQLDRVAGGGGVFAVKDPWPVSGEEGAHEAALR